jgi:hypothetical protein
VQGEEPTWSALESVENFCTTHQPENLSHILDMYEVLADLPYIDALYSDEAGFFSSKGVS